MAAVRLSVQAGSAPASLPLFALTLTFPVSTRWLPVWDTAVGPWFSTSVSIQQSVLILAFRAGFNRAGHGIAFLGSQEKQSDSSSRWKVVATGAALSQGKAIGAL